MIIPRLSTVTVRVPGTKSQRCQAWTERAGTRSQQFARGIVDKVMQAHHEYILCIAHTEGKVPTAGPLPNSGREISAPLQQTHTTRPPFLVTSHLTSGPTVFPLSSPETPVRLMSYSLLPLPYAVPTG